MPGFIADNHVREVPSVGQIATAVGTLFLNRSDKNNRSAIFKQIIERQERSEKGEAPPLLIFPEGASTNG